MALQNPTTQTEQESVESGQRMDRVWFIRENQNGVIPADPDWNLYSDRVVEFSASLNPAVERLEQLGSPDAGAFGRALEENEVTVLYSLQKALVDSEGEPVDACYDAYARTPDTHIPNTHSIVARDDVQSPGPDDPDGCAGQRRYIVVKGGKADATMEPDTTEADPIPVELTYMARKVRSFHIYQPDEPSALEVVSSSPNDDTQEITFEDEGGSMAETLTLTGDQPVTTEGQFPDVDAAHLSDDCEGDVSISLVDGGEIMTILGGETYGSQNLVSEGDRGVPALGDGSVPSEIGGGYEDIQGDVVDFGLGDGVPTPALNNITFEVDNNLEVRSRGEGALPAVETGNRNITLETDVIGERSSHDMIEAAYETRPLQMGWELGRSRVVLPDSRMTEPPEPARAPDEAFAEIAGTFTPQTIEFENVE